MNDNQFRFLHVSDLHLCQEANRRNFLSLLSTPPSRNIDVAQSIYQFGPRALLHPTSYSPSTLSGLSEFVHSRNGAYDAILISGDVATSGRPIDHAIAFNYVDGKPVDKWKDNDGRPVLSHQGTYVLVCPGNHDNYNGNNPRTPSNRNFVLKFGKYLPKFDDYVGHSVFTGEDSALAIIYADFGFQQNKDARNVAHLFGGGKVNPAVLNEMVARTIRFRTTRAISQKNRAVIWMIHFAPFDSGDATLELTDRQAVVEAASQTNVSHILCGHTHRASIFEENGVKIYCAGSATAVDCQNQVHEITYDISKDTLSRRDFRWSFDDGTFVA
jgi:3',5'-cyclic AMP phosphodiesterase CpdA